MNALNISMEASKIKKAFNLKINNKNPNPNLSLHPITLNQVSVFVTIVIFFYQIEFYFYSIKQKTTMKPFKTFQGVGVLALALFLFASCSKNMDETSSKGDTDVAQFIGGPPTNVCAPFIGLQVRNNAGGSYFFVNDRTTLVNQQEFNGDDFSVNWLMQVSAGPGGTPFENDVAEAIGVKSDADVVVGTDEHFINVGEVLILKLGSSYLNQVYMRGVELQLLGVAGTVGYIDYLRGGVLLESDTISSNTFSSFGYSKFVTSAFNIIRTSKMFDEIRLSCAAGRYQLRGRNPNPQPTYLPQTRFYLADPKNQVVWVGGPSNDANYVGRIVNGVIDDVTNYQTFTGTPEGSDWVLSGSPSWLEITSETGTSLSYSFTSARWGVYTTGVSSEQRFITGPEKVTITKGADLAHINKFGGIEVRATYHPLLPKFPLQVDLYDGATLVGTFQTTVPGTTPFVSSTVFYPADGKEFDRVEVTGTGPDASIGGGSGPYIRLYKGCQ